MDEKKIGGESTAADSPEAQQKPKVLGQVIGKRIEKLGLLRQMLSKPKRRKTLVLLITALVLVVAGITTTVYLYMKKGSSNDYQPTKTDRQINEVNNALLDNDKRKAYEAAKKALAESPNDLYVLQMTAGLAKEFDQEESKRLFTQAFEVFRQNTNLDTKKQNAITYITAGQLAQEAGKIDLAKQYYQKAIEASDPGNPNNNAIMNDAQERLQKLQ